MAALAEETITAASTAVMRLPKFVGVTGVETSSAAMDDRKSWTTSSGWTANPLCARDRPVTGGPGWDRFRSPDAPVGRAETTVPSALAAGAAVS